MSSALLSKFNELPKILLLLLSEFYIVNLLILSTYFWVRLVYRDEKINMTAITYDYLWHNVKDTTKADFQTWEMQFFGAIAFTAAWRIYRACTSAASACFTALGYTQLFVGVMSFLVNEALCLQYAIAFGLVFLLIEQPCYKAEDEVEVFTPVLIQEKVRSAASPGVAYLVFLHTKWSISSMHAYTIFSELSRQYTSERITFAKLDLSVWPNWSKKLGVDISPQSWQLPTIILYENGLELKRLPKRSGKELRRDTIVKAFELDMRLATSKQARVSKLE
ncbi:hypothetical protein CEUSTIGMA_g3013.t1 [Chlamydomonas eustigma]|uniref:Thioredoxin domain-containing protein n=1 Tax=Chlamydomonas eustigma TaxID=1157962 RepID=A0A250WYI9_9CHLO|nr:hypothetical protein CEUSTIGMA_g3013.t1 [Chlamydomonas eustigma]|eukprot:GAX75570.1 hypothetical protein CEUSTIGMA_g3013.t1 [Chlamydomonas eustigma]